MRTKFNFKNKLFVRAFITLFVLLIAFFIYSFIADRSTFGEVDKWDGVSVASSFSSGNGSLDNPYVISTSSQFMYFKSLIDGDNSSTYRDKYYVLENDLDFDNHSISGIGSITNDSAFMGNFDGNGYTISNILIDKGVTADDVDYYGLFTKTKNAYINNLNINNLKVVVKNGDNLFRVGSVIADASSLVDETNTKDEVGIISNISISNSSIDLRDTEYNKDNIIGLFSSSIDKKININNIYMDLDINTNYNEGIYSFSKILESDINNILLDINSNNYSFNDFKFNDSGDGTVSNKYYVSNGKYYLGQDEVTIDSIINEFNSEMDDYYFEMVDDTFKCIKYDKDNVTNKPSVVNDFVLSNDTSDIPEHESSISDGVVYVNDLEASYNYYMGLNYTTIDSGSLPTYSERYSDSNLVPVAISYSGTDLNNSNLVGSVSPTESETEYIYYKYYPIVDGEIKIELIDNPFSARPNGKGFNGWATSYPDAVISYDSSTYTRYLTIPVNSTNKISIHMNAIWYTANIQTNSSGLNKLDNAGMKHLNTKKICETKVTTEDKLTFTDGLVYYERKTATAGTTYYPDFYMSRNVLTAANGASVYCSSRNGCTYYVKTTDTDYDSSKTYYFVNSTTDWWGDVRYSLSNATFTIIPAGSTYEECSDSDELDVPENGNLAGFFYKENYTSTTDSYNYYNSNGERCSEVSCRSGDMYRLIQYNDPRATNYGTDTYPGDNYYYLVTRDMNILLVQETGKGLSSYVSNNKPLTLTSSYDGSSLNSNYYINAGSTTMGNDFVLENIYVYGTTNTVVMGSEWYATPTIDTTNSINANSHNFKIGRNVKNTRGDYYDVFNNVIGTTLRGTSGNPEVYKVIVESGTYNGLVNAYSNGTKETHVTGQMVYGSDYDRVNNDNNKLLVYFNALASVNGNFDSNDKVTPSSDMLIKSGMYGLSTVTSGGWNSTVTGVELSTDSAYGVYVGGRSNTHYSNSLRRVTVLGGIINSVNGGPCVANNLTTNSTAFYMLGGYANTVYGGAATTTTYGNRIVSITGGVVGYNVFGGSNAYNGGSSDGQLSGSTLIYVGGNSVIGSEDTSGNRFNAEHGSVFGAGNGQSGSSSAGRVYSSHIIIDGSTTINGNVYGGGNYGSVGFSSGNSKDATIEVHGGDIKNNVYGGGNNIGTAMSSVESNTYLNYYDGKLEGSLFGGSRTNGTIYGSTNIKVFGGHILTDVYGGGEGNNTYVSRNVTLNIGSNNYDSSPTIDGSVYGGSAFGTINNTYKSQSSNTCTVTVNKGTIKNSAFGGGKGSSSYTPYTAGNITVNINGGNIGNVFGGFDNSGTTTNDDVVYLNGGVIGNAYGGGDNTGQTTTKIYLQGSSVTNLFGGSNQSGNVTTSNVYATSGSFSYIYGGNNIAGSTATTNVSVNSFDNSKGNVYGGGNQADSTTSNVLINGSKLNNVIGGGKNAGVPTTNVDVSNNSSCNFVFGGSDQSGNVKTSNITIDTGNGKINSVYGGNNDGGSTTTSKVNINSGIINSVYGGGNQAGGDKTNVKVVGGTITDIFGGSNQTGDISTSNVVVGGDSIGFDYSFTNYSGQYQGTSKAYIYTVDVSVTNNSDETLNKWNMSLNVPDDSLLYANDSNTNVNLNNGVLTFNEVNKYYGVNAIPPGGTYKFSFKIASDVLPNRFKISRNYDSALSNALNITNVYGGNNAGGVTAGANVSINGGFITNVYGGGNEAAVNSAKVIVNGSNITYLYGGGRSASVNGSTSVDVDGANITGSMFGGGDNGQVTGNTKVNLTNSNILQNAYAGGNGSSAVVIGDTNITIDGDTVIGSDNGAAPSSGCVFGGGNAANSGEESSKNSKSTVNIVGGHIYGNVYGGAKMAKVYGTTDTNIGTSAVSFKGVIESNIKIGGTVFGGGESNADGKDNYDWTFISVYGVTVDIDGTDYLTNGHDFSISGSIFGSGNASSSEGASIVNITNLGTSDVPNKSISIQRVGELNIRSSVIELSGTFDRTNELGSYEYSFNRIDKLNLLNNSTLLLQNNANLLKEFYSGVEVNGNISKAEVSIDDDSKKLTKNVDNRLYMLTDENLNVTINQQATSYGKVTGMTFFGMYQVAGTSYNYGVYDRSLSYGDNGDAGLVISGGSYVLGLHSANHDITKDGFYSNYITKDDNYASISTKYIDPTEIGNTGYRWSIGAQTIKYKIKLTASRYSSLGTGTVQLSDFAAGDTTFTVVGFNSGLLGKDVSLVDSNNVPRIGKTLEEANNIYGLSMKSETQEWTGYGTTKYYSSSDTKYSGTTKYLTDSGNTAPSLMFYLYHAKNINREGDLGSVTITLEAAVPIDEINSEISLIQITVEMNAKKSTDDDNYDASITYDKRYEMPSATDVNITNNSQFTAYYSMIANADSFSNVYGKNNDYYHVLTTNYALPVGTRITMLDFGQNDKRPEYYYYEITDDIYKQAVAELNSNSEITYKLSNFIKMGSTSNDNTYDDKVANKLYYEDGLVDEEFIFIFDFKNTNQTGEHLNNKMLFELRNGDGFCVKSVYGIRQDLMVYNLYEKTNAVLEQRISNNSDYLYYNIDENVGYSTSINYNKTLNQQSIIDTNYESNSMGLNISFYTSSGDVVSSSLLSSTSIKINGVDYFADSDGIFRIKLANKVSNIIRNITISIGKDLPAGKYTMRYTLFASDDGLHNSDTSGSTSKDFTVYVVSSNNTITVDCDDKEKVVDGNKGLNMNLSKFNTYNISYTSDLNNPSVRVEVYKRDITDSNSNIFTSVPFNSLFSNTLPSYSGNEMLLNVKNKDSMNFNFVDNLTSGTYRVVFKLYDNSQLIDQDIKYIIVKKEID